jgi:acyl transferase domain-containing protein
MSNAEQMYHGDEIAIIGLAGRFPGARTLEAFWHNLRHGVESISFFSEQELLEAGVDPALLKHPCYVKAKGVLDDVAGFDAAFFGYTPREAEIMDPQQRLFLECAAAALEHAGYLSDSAAPVGVFAGASMSTYALGLYLNSEIVERVGTFQIGLGNDKDYLPTRVSYKLNLKGPSVSVQSACSSSLVAVHLACQSLLNGECAVALAGGVSITLPNKAGYLYQEGGIASPDGHCRAFDANAQGTVGGNGVAVVALKLLTTALEDGDTIHAVIKGSAINNDGALKAGYTAPSVQGQAEVIAEALTMARVEPESISYIEAHGTATPVGDPIELAALARVFQETSGRKQFCGIGSVKSNIGHLDAAAGVTGLIKTVLALQHRELPPSLHFEQPNPNAELGNSPFYVVDKLMAWPAGDGPRRAGVSSFGIGGTNAHVILEEAPATEPGDPGRTWQLLTLSAKTGSALDAATANLLADLRQHPDVDLADVAYTLQVGRKTLSHRRTLACQSVADAIAALEADDPERVLTAVQNLNDRPVVFMFPGQGAQYPNMGRDLYEHEPVFRGEIDRCATLLLPHLGIDLRALLYPQGAHSDAGGRELEQTRYAQPALFAIEYALARLWQSWGIKPAAMIGHSIGEYVAATLAGVFSLEDALQLVAARGRLMQAMPQGAMLAVALAETELRPLLGTQLDLAAVNGPALCVVAGDPEAIAALQERFARQGIHCRPLHTSHAFHSRLMEPIVAPFTEQLRQIRLSTPKIPFVSNLSGSWITAAEATDPAYWARHLRQPVRFADGVRALLGDAPAERICLEVGPGQTLSTFVRQQIDPATPLPILSLRHPQQQRPDHAVLLEALGRLWLAGVRIDWRRLYRQQRRRRIPLPTYPFEHQPFWIEAAQRSGREQPPAAGSLWAKQPAIADWFYIPAWKRALPPSQAQEQAEQPGRWLLLCDSSGVGKQLAQRLAQQGHEAISVYLGAQFARHSDHAYTLNPARPEDYAALCADLQQQDRLPARIVHLWSVTSDDEPPGSFDAAQERGCYSLLWLVQALDRCHLHEALRISVIANRLHDVSGTDTLMPEKATILGPCTVIPQEYPHMSCQQIDIVLPQPESWQAAQLIDQLTDELLAQTADPAVAYRGQYRYVQSFEQTRLQPAASQPRLRPGGVYLITGGLGRIGLTFAEYLARTVQARLVLLGRSALPERDQWQQWPDASDGIGRKLRQIQELEALGAEVLTLSADVADPEQMQAAIATTIARFGALHGVIHAAGLVGAEVYRPIQETDRSVCEAHFQPKARGVYVLEAVLRGRPLDFCLLQSSLASILGGLGFAAYAAANLFMDAFAQQQSRAGRVAWISINWDAWRLDAASEQPSAAGASELTITPDEGADALARLLTLRGTPQIIVSTGELHGRIDRWVRREPLRSEHTEGNGSGTYSRPQLQNRYVAPRNAVEEIIAGIWQDMLGIAQVGVHDNFFALGGHSLLMTQIGARLRETFQFDLPLRSLFEATSVAELAQVLIAHEAAPGQTEKIARVIQRLASMSETQARELLQSKQATREDG